MLGARLIQMFSWQLAGVLDVFLGVFRYCFCSTSNSVMLAMKVTFLMFPPFICSMYV